MCLAASTLVVAAMPSVASTGSWTITMFCKDDGDENVDYLLVSYSFDGLPGHFGAVSGRHEYGAGVNDWVQTLNTLSVIGGHTENAYEVAAEHLSFGSYAPAPGDEFTWRVNIDGHGVVFSGTAFVGGAGCSAPAIIPATPTISGSAKVGKTLTSSPGTWSPDGVAFARQWFADGVAIGGATAAHLVIAPAQVGKRISVRVTGSKSGFSSAVKSSALTAKVLPGSLSPTPKPKISGQAKVGKKLTAKPGVWGPGPVAKSYRWYANGKAIAGAKFATFKPKAGHVGKRITVRVTGSKYGYAKVTRVSKPTKKVKN